MRKAYVAGVGMTPFGRFPDTGMKALGRRAVQDALDDAGVPLERVQAVFYGNALAGVIDGQECIRGEVLTFHLGLSNVPVINVENACASGGTAMHLACRTVMNGEWDCVLAVGVEKMHHPDRTRALKALRGAMDVDAFPEGDLPADRSPFIDVYAGRAQRLMEQRGVTASGLARIAAKAWSNGALNVKAQRTQKKTPEEILGTRMVVDPLTVAMCALIGDGAAAAVIMADPVGNNRSIPVRGSQIRTIAANPQGPTAAGAASTAAYEEAGAGPGDLSLAEVHDATAVGEMGSWVDLGLCPPGSEEEWAQNDHTCLGGPLPVNPSGGLIARGHPLGASGLAQVYELVLQLRGEAGARQVDRPRLGLAHVGGGILDGRAAVASVHLLERPRP